jgi:hypothetical protein
VALAQQRVVAPWGTKNDIKNVPAGTVTKMEIFKTKILR